MPEYITKEQAIDVVHEAIANIVNSDSEMVCLTDLEIEIQMTITDYTESADVVPVVHARWERYHLTDTRTGFIDIFMRSCSYCRKLVNVDTDYKYCPQCGARMEGED